MPGTGGVRKRDSGIARQRYLKTAAAREVTQRKTGWEAGGFISAKTRHCPGSSGTGIGGKMNEVLEKIGKIGIVPVVKIDRAEDALPLAEALCAGGLPCAEVTFRTEAAAEAIKIMTENFPGMCVGAGTVLNAAQVDAAVEAGAKFIVSPGLNANTVKYCIEKKVPDRKSVV